MEKAGVDVVPRLITAVIPASSPVDTVTSVTFNASLDGKMAFNPLYYLYETCASF